jgi:orotate phosphoribosyltransferase
MVSTQQLTGTNTGDLAQAFVAFSVEAGVLRLGEFKTKAGRMSPYFFNAGLFDDGAKLARLAQFYAQRILSSGIEFDMVFGPAYKGIPLGAAVSMELALPITAKKRRTMARAVRWWEPL